MNADALVCCLFCLTCRGNIPDPKGQTCTYGFGHEFPTAPAQKQERKPDLNRCTKCNLHPKNPLSATNGCAHDYTRPG